MTTSSHYRIWSHSENKMFDCSNDFVVDMDNRVMVKIGDRLNCIEYDYVMHQTDYSINLWSGLYDKNKKKIYDKDIIRYYDSDGITESKYCVAEVSYETNPNIVKIPSFILWFKKRSYLTLVDYYLHVGEIEVVGNVYENKNLL